jgi:hypothetical protein
VPPPITSSGPPLAWWTATATRCCSPTARLSSVVDALRGYRNPDGGFGHALEPDLRCPGSQPAPTLYALEMLGEAREAEQQDDGGWMFDRLAWSPAQATAWRGIVTIRALAWLRDNGRL